jgi:hypothetical protein
MSELANIIKSLAVQGRSRSSDKLALLCIAATSVSVDNPEMMKKIKTFTMEWRSVEGEIVPFVRTEFHDVPPKA